MTLSAQENDLAKISRMIEAGNAKIEAVDSELPAQVRADRIAILRKEFVAQLEAITSGMAKRQAAAKDGIDLYSPSSVRRQALAKYDPSRSVAMFEMLKRTTTPALLLHLKDAIRDRNLAYSEAVKLEFDGRTNRDGLEGEFSSLFNKAVDPQAVEMQTEFRKISGLADYAGALLKEFSQGVPDPAGRLSAAREAGLGGVAGPPDQSERVARLREAAGHAV